MQGVPVNYWAILVCGVVSMVLGSLWYGKFFRKPWEKMMGWENVDPAKRAEMMKTMQRSYILAFIGALLMAYILSHAIIFAQSYLGESDMSAATMTAFFNWLGFIAPVTLTVVLWEGKPWKLWLLNSSYYLVQLLIFAFILIAWK